MNFIRARAYFIGDGVRAGGIWQAYAARAYPVTDDLSLSNFRAYSPSGQTTVYILYYIMRFAICQYLYAHLFD